MSIIADGGTIFVAPFTCSTNYCAYFTFFCWIKFSTTPGVQGMVFLAGQTTGFQSLGLVKAGGANSFDAYQMQNNGTNQNTCTVAGNPVPVVGTWYPVLATIKNNSSATLFSPQGTATASSLIGVTNTDTIQFMGRDTAGLGPASNYMLAGCEIAEVAIWTTQLSAAEQTDLVFGQVSPGNIQPDFLLTYLPLIGDTQDLGPNKFTFLPVGTGLTSFGDHPITDTMNVSRKFFTSAAAATAYTFAGPTTGRTGVASTQFTVTPNGSVTSNTIVTPHSTGTGTFSPTTVTFLAGTTTALTFVYTPTTSTTATLSVTNNGGLTNPGNLTYVSTAVPAKTVGKRRTSRTNRMGQLRSNFSMQMALAQSITSATVLAVPQALTANFSKVFNTLANNGSYTAVAGGVTNGATGPTVPATVSLMGSIDNINWYEISSFVTTVGNSVASSFSFQNINDGWPLLSLYVHGNSDQAVVLNAVLCAAVNYGM